MNIRTSDALNYKINPWAETKSCFCNHGSPCICGSRKESNDHKSHQASSTKTYANSMRNKSRLPNRLCESNLTIFTNGHHKPCHRLNNTAHTSGIPYRVPFTQNTNEMGVYNSHRGLDSGTVGAEGDGSLVQRRRLIDSGLASASTGLCLNTVEANIVYRNVLMTASPHTHDAFIESAQPHDLYRDIPDDHTASGDAGTYVPRWQLQNHSPDSLSTQWPFSASTISSTGSLVGQGFPLSPNDDFVLSPDGDQASSVIAERPWPAVDIAGGPTSAVMYTPTDGYSVDAQKYSMVTFPRSSGDQAEVDDMRSENVDSLNAVSTGHFGKEDMLDARQADTYQAKCSVNSDDNFVHDASAVTSNVQHLVEPDFTDDAGLTYRTDGYAQPEMDSYIMPPVHGISAGEACQSRLVHPEDGDSSFDSPIVTDSPVSSSTFFTQCQLATSADSEPETWDPMMSSMSRQAAANSAGSGSVSAPLDLDEVSGSSVRLPTWMS